MANLFFPNLVCAWQSHGCKGLKLGIINKRDAQVFVYVLLLWLSCQAPLTLFAQSGKLKQSQPSNNGQMSETNQVEASRSNLAMLGGFAVLSAGLGIALIACIRARKVLKKIPIYK